MAGRLLRLVGQRLDQLGLAVVPPAAVARFGAERFGTTKLEIAVEPSEAPRSSTPVRVAVRRAGQPFLDLEGTAGELDRLADAVAAKLVQEGGRGESVLAEGKQSSVERSALPFFVHKLMGEAERRERTGSPGARLLYERATARAQPALALEALVAASRLRLEEGADAPGLSSAALDRADDHRRRGDPEAAMAAALDAVRFGAPRRIFWTLAVPPDAAVTRSEDQLIVGSPADWVALDPATGRFLGRGAGAAPFRVQGEELLRRGARIFRRAADGRVRWSVDLPAHLDGELERSGAGQVALLGADRIGWIETSLGEFVVGSGRPLAVGEAGALVDREDRVMLLRPGRAAPAWTSTTPAARSLRGAALTTARALLWTEDTVFVLDAHDGRTVAAIAAPNGRVLAASGRRAAVAVGGGRVRLLDILAGSVTAEVEGPSLPVAAAVGPFSVAVVHASGDLMQWDPDGPLLDRALLPGPPIGVLPGTDGFVVHARGRLLRFSFLQPGVRFDVDVLLEAARDADRAGRPAAARAIADHLSALGAGRIAAAETLRARLSREAERPRVAAAAEARAKAFADPLEPGPPFLEAQVNERR